MQNLKILFIFLSFGATLAFQPSHLTHSPTKTYQLSSSAAVDDSPEGRGYWKVSEMVEEAASSSATSPSSSSSSSSSTSSVPSTSTYKFDGSAFCGGYVGGEGPEPIWGMTGTSKNFDPIGFTTRAPEWIPWFREAELKHGRAAMLATVGFVAPELFRVPGAQFSFESVPQVVAAHDACPDSMKQIILWISLMEACSFAALANMNEYDRRPGDFSFDPLGLYPKDEAGQREMQLKELKNGRLAMIAIGGMVTQATISGHGFPYV